MKLVLGVFALAVIILSLKASTAEPQQTGVCVPLYDRAGLECCKPIGGQ
jgi:hypothetical protein